MRVEFVKVDNARYRIAITRRHEPDIPSAPAPGYDDWMPHELAHYLVEEQFGIRLGVFGQVAAGGGNFWPAPGARTGRNRRTTRRLDSVAGDDVGRSERLVGVCEAQWRRRRFGTPLPDYVDEATTTEPGVLECVGRIDEVAGRWHALPPGESLRLDWPPALTVNPAGLRVGRRNTDRPRTRRRR